MANKKPRELSTNLRRGAETLAAAPPRNGQVFSILEKQIEEQFERIFVRLIWRLGLVSQKDVRDLSQRIERVERHLQIRRPPRRPQSLVRR